MDSPDDKYYVQDIPCGKCDLCLIENRYSKALRIMLEAESWPGKTYFITLTYNNECLGGPDLVHNDWAQFVKNFRQKYCQAKYCDLYPKKKYLKGREKSHTFKKIKQVMAGEYGDDFGRKHFHGIIFNHHFSDIRDTGFFSKKGNPIFTSDALRDVWLKGNVQVEEITFDLALYVGAYVTDKALDGDDPNVGHGKPQYGRFGRGIGKSWLEKYWKDVLSAGKVMLRDRDYPIPRAFRIWMKENICPKEYDAFHQRKTLQRIAKQKRLVAKGDGSFRRAKAKGRIHLHKHLKRKVDSEYQDSQKGQFPD